MNIVTNPVGPWLLIKPMIKNLDASNTSEFMDQMRERVSHKAKVMVDLSEIDFMDSSGIGILLSCLRLTAESGGQLALCGLTKQVKAVFDLMRLQRMFEIHTDFSAHAKEFQ